MTTYKLISASVVCDTGTGAFIPIPSAGEESHPLYLKYLADVADGATVLPADPAPIVYAAERAFGGKVRTTDATATEILRLALAPMTGYAAVVTMIGVDAGNGAVKVIRASLAAKRLGGGALAIGAPVVIAQHADAGASTWVTAAAASGNDYVITVAGAAGRTVDWSLMGTVARFGPSGLTD